MKKTLRALVLALVMGLIVISLTGCGSDKLVMTKETQDETLGNSKEEVIITFKEGKADTIKTITEFDNEEMAKGMYGLISLGMSMDAEGKLEGMEAKQEGKKLIVTINAKTYAESIELTEEEMTKEVMKKTLEEDGYTVK